jgi:ribosomal-protein-alanine N-acetyltransferase
MTGASEKLDGKRLSLLWAGPERAAAIAGLHAGLFDPPWSESGVRDMLDHPAATSFVATLGGPADVVGFIIGQIAADESEILSIGVHPEHQKRGVGRLLVEGLIRAVKRAEIHRIYLDVATDNAAALNFYSKLKFTPSGVRKGYYVRSGAPAVDAVIMSLVIPV